MTSWEPVVDYLLENMQKQTYKKDERLPSEHELAQRFELTRIEVRKAYDRLKEMGYVYFGRERAITMRDIWKRWSLYCPPQTAFP